MPKCPNTLWVERAPTLNGVGCCAFVKEAIFLYVMPKLVNDFIKYVGLEVRSRIGFCWWLNVTLKIFVTETSYYDEMILVVKSSNSIWYNNCFGEN